ncbi:uncharacterized protein LOC5515175 [Nematostella vectensis]|uniref:uncharacterized protein LOC5515175 n=1 Tax=Nematostella vectensis TaxID=45351 RepID=UPI0020773158|nr:uncharacterized protein LOC5515175 [Nematostella vectensis]XP_032240686.2 uncharacterized protein LOC5515175 [Nematostella vectensis]XP_032240687.2 uncharacterized protein LOC5515175 [Nematostella vectensis]XP_032240689.2 uncharacterized protein LOC5515175 [Nematostella vectensis]XP_032240691.2 uncharacterized protein LOC5515175 [Nematostella vectensis]XP_048585212.1 uncharacterized protein LOC5515175 [Nematostella vectensis]
MPYLKVHVQGQRYAISGLNDRTTSKHILCSLARMHSMLSLVGTDSEIQESGAGHGTRKGVDYDDETTKRLEKTGSLPAGLSKHKGLRKDEVSSRERVHRTQSLSPRDRRSWPLAFNEPMGSKKDCGLGGSSRAQSGARSSDSSEEVAKWKTKLRRSLSKTDALDGKYSSSQIDKLETKQAIKSKKKKRRKSEEKELLGEKVDQFNSKKNLDRTKERHSKKVEKNRQDNSKTRSQQKCKSYDFSPSTKPDSTIIRKDSKYPRTKKRSKSHNGGLLYRDIRGLPYKDLEYVRNVYCDVTETSESEYSRKRIFVTDKAGLRQGGVGALQKRTIERLVTKAVERRLPNLGKEWSGFEDIAFQQRAAGEEEMKRSLLRLIMSQGKCLHALNTCIKTKDTSITRYSKWYKDVGSTLRVDVGGAIITPGSGSKVQPENKELANICEIKDSSDKANETDQDTGISELHSDSSVDTTRMTSGCGVNVSFTTFPTHSVSHMTKSVYEDLGGSSEDIGNCIVANEIPDDATELCSESNHELSDRTDATCSKGSVGSAETVTVGMLSDISDTTTCSTFEVSDHVTPDEKYQHELNKNRALRDRIDSLTRDIELTESRIKEQHTLISTLTTLKELNQELIASQENPSEGNANDERKLQKSIDMSTKLYEYQKKEIRANTEQILRLESRIRRKRWHVKSAVRELERFITRPFQAKPMGSPGLYPGFHAGNNLLVSGTFV